MVASAYEDKILLVISQGHLYPPVFLSTRSSFIICHRPGFSITRGCDPAFVNSLAYDVSSYGSGAVLTERLVVFFGSHPISMTFNGKLQIRIEGLTADGKPFTAVREITIEAGELE